MKKISRPWSFTIPKIARVGGVNFIEIPPVVESSLPPAPDGFEFVPASISSVPSYRTNSGGTSPTSTIESSDSVLFEFVATGTNGSVDMNLIMSLPPDSSSGRYKGFGFNLENVANCKALGVRLLASTNPGAVNIWDAVVTTGAYGEWNIVRNTGNPVSFPDPYRDSTVDLTASTNLDSCTPLNKDIRIGCFAAAAGTVKLRVNNMYWIKSLGTSC